MGITAVAIAFAASNEEVLEESYRLNTKVTLHKLGDEEIDWYVKTNESMKNDIVMRLIKAPNGDYDIESLGALLVDKVEGDYCNIRPIAKFAHSMDKIFKQRQLQQKARQLAEQKASKEEERLKRQ